MKLLLTVLCACFGIVAVRTSSTDYLAKAAALTPPLIASPQPPISVVTPVRNESTFLRWSMAETMTVAQLYNTSFNKNQSFTLDFGGHRTGYFSFYLYGIGYSIDSPAHLRLTFGEVPGDVAEDFYPFQGTLSESWLPQEEIHVDYLPQQVNMPKRFAFRYVRIDVLAGTANYDTMFANFTATGVTTAIEANVAPLPENTSSFLREVDRVALNTLRDCFQTISEDGPRRDLRLWGGDFRLHALTNQVTYKNNDLIKRCLYLFAGTQRPSGFVPSCVFEKPFPHSDGTLALDFAAMFVATVNDYYQANNELDFVQDVWPVVADQLDLLHGYIGENGIFNNYNGQWCFVDWCDPLDRETPMQGILIYTFRAGAQLAQVVGNDTYAQTYQAVVKLMTQAALSNLWDSSLHVFMSGSQRQVSWASQAWMILAGVSNGTDAQGALLYAMNDTNAVRPGSPYMYHYVVDALLSIGLKNEAVTIVTEFWGGMLMDGADTFWEVYDPSNSLLSPYNDVHLNSFCHGWGVTPSYFIRSGLLG